MTEFSDETQENLAHFIHGWCDVTPELQKRIEEFSLLWQVFEWQFANKHFGLAKLEQSGPFEEAFGCLLNIAFQADIESARSYFEQRYTDDQRRQNLVMDNGGADLLGGLKESGSTETGEQIARTKAILYVVFRLRNNLFHGAKAAYGYLEQDENFRNAISVLNAVLRAKKRAG